MSLNHVLCFDHLPVGNTDTVAAALGRGWVYGGFPGTIGTTQPTVNQTFLLSYLQDAVAGQTAGRWLTLGSALTPSRMDVHNWRIQQGEVFDVTTPRSIVGFRMRKIATTLAFNFVWFANTGVLNNRDDAARFQDNVDYYVEFVIDRIENSLTVYVDGVFYKTLAMNNALLVSPTTQLIFHNTAAINTTLTTTLQLKDIYFIDDTQDSTPCTRLGAITPRRMTVSAVAAATGWANAGTVFNGLITTAANSVTPVVSSPDSRDPVTADLAVANVAATDRIIAITTALSGRRTSANTAQIEPTLQLGASQRLGKNAAWATTNTMEFCKPLGVHAQAADGTPWTLAKLTASKLILKPTLGV